MADPGHPHAVRFPEPQIVEKLIHGQLVQVKVYPPVGDAAWLRPGLVRERLSGEGLTLEDPTHDD